MFRRRHPPTRQASCIKTRSPIALAIFWLGLLCAGHSSWATSPYTPCDSKLAAPFQVFSSGWSREPEQRRMYSAEDTGQLGAAELEHLEVAWAFVFKGAKQPRSLPAITDQAIFIGSEEGVLFALHPDTGCGHWHFQAEDQIRTAISVGQVQGRWLVFFGDNTASIYAVDALNGSLVWKQQLDEHQFSVITGSPVLYGDRLFATVASWSVGLALNPWGSCCKFRGSLSALNALTGELQWQSHTIAEPARVTGRNWLGGKRYGPSGAGIWSSPTIDEKRQRLYVGTGQNYSSPYTKTSDAILAFDMDDGHLLWSQQVLPEDAWNVACEFSVFSFNCPEEDGPDYDFGAPPMLVNRSDGRDVIIGATKGGMAYAFDPDQAGAILWQQSVGRGGVLGGIHWGMAATDEYAYIPVADTDANALSREVLPGTPKPGLSKVDLFTGDILWYSSTRHVCDNKGEDCRFGLSAAVTGIPGAILAPTLDGILRAFSTEDGSLLWAFDSTIEVNGVNGLSGHGGTLDAGGVVAANGKLFFNSGYGGLISAGSQPGNVFFVLQKKTP